MGTRGQVHIKDTDIYLYQHFDAYNLPEKIRKVIEEGKRLDDPEYLARIIFYEMIKDYKDQYAGFGIGSTQHDDIEYLVEINCAEEIVTVHHFKGAEDIANTFTFKECKIVYENMVNKSSNGHGQ
jgi:hypothetical protein